MIIDSLNIDSSPNISRFEESLRNLPMQADHAPMSFRKRHPREIPARPDNICGLVRSVDAQTKWTHRFAWEHVLAFLVGGHHQRASESFCLEIGLHAPSPTPSVQVLGYPCTSTNARIGMVNDK